jgi:hypothetical protein
MTNSFLVTAYTLSLGAYDSVTGIPARQYTPASAEVIIGEKNGPILKVLGYYAQADALGITKYDLDEGDIIMDNYNATPHYWLVLGRSAVTWGNTFVYYQLNLQRMERPNFHILSTYLGGFDPAYFDESYFAHFYITA